MKLSDYVTVMTEKVEPIAAVLIAHSTAKPDTAIKPAKAIGTAIASNKLDLDRLNAILSSNEVTLRSKGPKATENLLKNLKKIKMNEVSSIIPSDQDMEDEERATEPSEEDCTITPSGRLGSEYAVACGGRFISNVPDMDQALDVIKNWQTKNNFYPTIWFVSDHGNAYPIDLEGNEIKENKDVEDVSVGEFSDFSKKNYDKK